MGVESAMGALISIALLLVIGLVVTAFAKKIRVSNLFLLLISGTTISFLNSTGHLHLYFSNVLLISLAIITLVMVVFEGTSSFNIKRLESISMPALKLVAYFILLSLIFIAPMVGFIFFGEVNFTMMLFGAVVAVVMAGTDPSTVFTMLKSGPNKIVQLLELESIFNTPFTIILPLIFLEIIQASSNSSAVLSDIVFGQFKPLMLEISAGIGLGILFGYFVAKNFKKYYSNIMAPIALLTFALVAYIGAEYIGGSGVLAVATMGLVFGSFAIKNMDVFHSFNETLSTIFVLLVFILAGFLVDTSFSFIFVLKVLFIVIIAMMVRFVAIDMILPKTDYSLREKFFMTVMMPKGVAVAVVALSLAVMDFVPGYESMISTLVQIILIGMIISLFFSTLVAHFSDKLLNEPNSSITSKSKLKSLNKSKTTIRSITVKKKSNKKTLKTNKSLKNKKNFSKNKKSKKKK